MQVIVLVLILSLCSVSAEAYTANKVAFEFLQNGQYRVTVDYTVPELKEFRESYVIFNRKKEAQAFYWKLIRGADFYPDDPKLVRFIPPKTKPTPW
jgi:hypothetical protein